MARRFSAAGAALALALSACAGSKKADPPKKPEQPVAKVFDVRGQDKRVAPDGEAEKCDHAWEQASIHPYQVMREGIPNTELCVVSRCSKCGATQHDCETKVRRRRGPP